jgi:hypothetical protein
MACPRGGNEIGSVSNSQQGGRQCIGTTELIDIDTSEFNRYRFGPIGVDSTERNGPSRLNVRFLFVIFHLGIDGPDVVLGRHARNYVVYSGHCCQHGMVLIVVTVLPVAADEK